MKNKFKSTLNPKTSQKIDPIDDFLALSKKCAHKSSQEIIDAIKKGQR